MKKLLFPLCLCFLLTIEAQEYDFVSDSLRLITMQELSQKGVPSSMENVFYEDGTKTTFQEVLPLLSKGELMPNMFVDSSGNYNTLVVVKPVTSSFEDLEANTEYSFIPKNLRLLPMDELYRKPPPRSLEKVFYNDGTPTSLEQVLPLIAEGKLTPKMYVNEAMEYVALIVVK